MTEKDYMKPAEKDFNWQGIGKALMPEVADIPYALLGGKGSEMDYINCARMTTNEFNHNYFAIGGKEGEPPELYEILKRAHLFTEETYQGIAQKRRTGEDVLFHQLRIVNRFMGWVNCYTNFSYITGRGFDLRTDDKAKFMLAAAIATGFMHDLPEDEKKYGYIFDVLVNEMARYGTVSVGGAKFAASDRFITIVQMGLNALKKPDGYKERPDMEVAEVQVQNILDLPKQLRLEFSHPADAKYLDLFSLFVGVLKMCDRNDNLTTLFQKKDDTYTPASDGTVQKIIMTTLHAFPRLEEAVDHFVFGNKEDQEHDAQRMRLEPDDFGKFRRLFKAFQPSHAAYDIVTHHSNNRLDYRSIWQRFTMLAKTKDFRIAYNIFFHGNTEEDIFTALYRYGYMDFNHAYFLDKHHGVMKNPQYIFH